MKSARFFSVNVEPSAPTLLVIVGRPSMVLQLLKGPVLTAPSPLPVNLNGEMIIIRRLSGGQPVQTK